MGKADVGAKVSEGDSGECSWPAFRPMRTSVREGENKGQMCRQNRPQRREVALVYDQRNP